MHSKLIYGLRVHLKWIPKIRHCKVMNLFSSPQKDVISKHENSNECSRNLTEIEMKKKYYITKEMNKFHNFALGCKDV